MSKPQKKWNHVKYPGGPAEGQEVRVLTVIGKPKGTVTHYYESEFRYLYMYWIRLEHGELLKDVTINEITGYETTEKED